MCPQVYIEALIIAESLGTMQMTINGRMDE